MTENSNSVQVLDTASKSLLKQPSTPVSTPSSLNNDTNEHENVSPNLMKPPTNTQSIRKSLPSKVRTLKSLQNQYATLPHGFNAAAATAPQPQIPPISPGNKKPSIGRQTSNPNSGNSTIKLDSLVSTPIVARPIQHSQSLTTLATPRKPVSQRSSLPNVVSQDTSTETIAVLVRVRPVLQHDTTNNRQCIAVHDNTVILDNNKLQKQHTYTYDHVFDQVATSDDIYQHIHSNIEAVLNGYHSTILAYGQTGSGKTFTISNLIQPIVQTLFNTVTDYTVKYSISYLEIYNERVYDLLATDSNNTSDRVTLDIRENVDGSFFVENLTQHTATDINSVTRLIEHGASNRMTNATIMNATSSRSHSVLCIQCERINNDGKSISSSKLNIVDLAGSEKLTQEYTTDISRETVGINLSLSTLASCIAALTSNAKHVPYRDSKLTRLLRDSFGGNAKTVMIACISPLQSSEQETLSTLRYAARVKLIKNKPVLLIDPTEQYISSLQQQIEQLKTALIHKNLIIAHMYNNVAELCNRHIGTTDHHSELTYESTEQCIQNPTDHTSMLYTMLQQPIQTSHTCVSTNTRESVSSFFNTHANDPLLNDLSSPTESMQPHNEETSHSMYDMFTTDITALKSQLHPNSNTHYTTLNTPQSNNVSINDDAQQRYIAALQAENTAMKQRMLDAGQVVSELQEHLAEVITNKSQLQTALHEVNTLRNQINAQQQSDAGCILM